MKNEKTGKKVFTGEYEVRSQPEVFATVCLGFNRGTWYRGIALRSLNDNPDYKKGRDLARGRMMKALVNSKSSDLVQRYDAVKTASILFKDEVIIEFSIKSRSNAQLSEQEKKITKKYVERLET